MRWLLALLCAVGTGVAQTAASQETYYVYDLNGRRVPAGWSVEHTAAPGESKTVEKAISVNGRTVPRQEVQEKIIQADASGKIVERTITRYDPNGVPGPPERVRVEETAEAGGGSRVVETVWRADINGRFRLAERSVTEVRKEGDREVSTTSVARPTLNGTLETVERIDGERRKTIEGVETQTSTYRRDASGNYYEAVRQISKITKMDNQELATWDQYLVRGSQLVLDGRTVTRTVKTPDGAQVSEVDIYRADVPGRPAEPGRPALLERQVIQKTKQEDGSVVESLLVRRASPNDPGKLGEPEKIGERVCTGKCAP